MSEAKRRKLHNEASKILKDAGVDPGIENAFAATGDGLTSSRGDIGRLTSLGHIEQDLLGPAEALRDLPGKLDACRDWGRRRQWRDQTEHRIWEAYCEGLTWRAIGARVGMPYRTAWDIADRLAKQMQDEGRRAELREEISDSDDVEDAEEILHLGLAAMRSQVLMLAGAGEKRLLEKDEALMLSRYTEVCQRAAVEQQKRLSDELAELSEDEILQRLHEQAQRTVRKK